MWQIASAANDVTPMVTDRILNCLKKKHSQREKKYDTYFFNLKIVL